MWQRGLSSVFWDNLEWREVGALALFSTALHRVGNIKAHLCEPEKVRWCSCTVKVSGEIFFFPSLGQELQNFGADGVPKKCQA